VKPWHQSRTVWVNVIGAGVELLNGHSAQLLEPWLLYLALAVLNILLRFATDEPIRIVPVDDYARRAIAATPGCMARRRGRPARARARGRRDRRAARDAEG
jgi:hypothetical protein